MTKLQKHTSVECDFPCMNECGIVDALVELNVVLSRDDIDEDGYPALFSLRDYLHVNINDIAMRRRTNEFTEEHTPQ